MGKAEQLILDILESAGEEGTYQTDLVRQSGFSKSRVSEVLSYLQAKGLISRISLGKNFKIISRKYQNKIGENVPEKDPSKKTLTLGLIRASEYPFVLPFQKALHQEMDLSLRFVQYDNGMDLSRDLYNLRLDLGIAPVLTHFFFFSMGSPIKMIAPAGSGGCAILFKESTQKSRRDFTVATTKLSTMEMMLRSSIREGDLSSSTTTRYFTSPKQMMNAAICGEVDAACIWEPYSTMLLRKRGFKKLFNYEDNGNDHICCAVAAGNHLAIDKLRRITSILGNSLEIYQRSPENYLSAYSELMRFDKKTIESASKKYSYPTNLDHRKLARQLEDAGVKIPLPSGISDAVLTPN
jgi:predicted transcriptional regulator